MAVPRPFYQSGVCPVKQTFTRPDEKPFITEEMKCIKRQIMREYEKKGKSDKYTHLKSLFQSKFQKEAYKYTETSSTV